MDVDDTEELHWSLCKLFIQHEGSMQAPDLLWTSLLKIHIPEAIQGHIFTTGKSFMMWHEKWET